MIQQKQKFKHEPEIGHYGDCDRTSLACILEIPRDNVPNWAEKYWGDCSTWAAERKAWLKSIGYALASMYYKDCSLDELLNYVGHFNSDVYWLLTGCSKNGTNHVVICLGDKIVWDPAIDNSGIVGPTDEGFFYVEFIVPIKCVRPDGMPYGTYGNGF